jgi:hypothetical protein
MKSLREQAISLRIEGKSYNEILATIGVPKSTLSSWLRDVTLPQKAKERLDSRVRQGLLNGLIKRNKAQTKIAQERSSSTRAASKKEIKDTLSLYELKLLGTALYWAEGYKRTKVLNGVERTAHTISFVNADPEMIALFIKFLVEVMEISSTSIRLYMRLYPQINEIEAKKYWMKITGLDKKHFQKTTNIISKSSSGIRPFNRLPWGTLQVEVCDTKQFHRLMGWIEGMKEMKTYDTVAISLG